MLLDYDGTLAPFAALPGDARPSEALILILQELLDDERNTVYIISGRDSTTLEQWLGKLPLHIICEHGAKVKHPDTGWKNTSTSDPTLWKNEMASIMEQTVAQCPGSFVEWKDFSVAFHYRNAEATLAWDLSRQLLENLEVAAPAHSLHVLDGNKVIEVRQQGIDKGTAARKVLDKDPYDFVLCIGDDKTDEDMFRELSLVDFAYTVKVGHGPTDAKFNVDTPHMVSLLLDVIGKADYVE